MQTQAAPALAQSNTAVLSPSPAQSRPKVRFHKSQLATGGGGRGFIQARGGGGGGGGGSENFEDGKDDFNCAQKGLTEHDFMHIGECMTAHQRYRKAKRMETDANTAQEAVQTAEVKYQTQQEKTQTAQTGLQVQQLATMLGQAKVQTAGLKIEGEQTRTQIEGIKNQGLQLTARFTQAQVAGTAQLQQVSLQMLSERVGEQQARLDTYQSWKQLAGWNGASLPASASFQASFGQTPFRGALGGSTAPDLNQGLFGNQFKLRPPNL